MNEIENKKNKEKSMKLRAAFLKKLNKIDKPLATLREKEKPIKSEMKKETLLLLLQKYKGSLTTTINNYMPKTNCLEETDTFLQIYMYIKTDSK